MEVRVFLCRLWKLSNLYSFLRTNQKFKSSLTVCLFCYPPSLPSCQVLHTLTDGTVPSAELMFTIKKLFDSKLKVRVNCLLLRTGMQWGYWLMRGWFGLVTGCWNSNSSIAIPTKRWGFSPFSDNFLSHCLRAWLFCRRMLSCSTVSCKWIISVRNATLVWTRQHIAI